MKRIDKIYLYVKEQTKHLTPDTLAEEDGVTTVDVSTRLGIQRTNASKDLNQLVRDELLAKIDGRPVRYVVKSALRRQPLTSHVSSYRENPHVEPAASSFLVDETENIFNQMVGSKGSMKTPVEQAKAAILYPPKGLNCLIIGPTGSGKTYFAHAMFQFAKAKQVIDNKKELVVFNCADYAHNPELLMSHLFGYVEGAFTGAKQSKYGIIQEADGGVLFLDEVHRLPPEGQEMIFYFMDHGTYSRLGETTKENHAEVRIVCATTEDPSSSLLNTFVRRIPIVIQLPNFNDRPAQEKIDLVKIMAAIEAGRIQKRIVLSEDVIKALIGSVTYGNVGQLKSSVQLVMAQGFLNHMDKDELVITPDELSDSIKEGLLKLASNRSASAEIAKYLEPQTVIVPNEPVSFIQADSYELPYNLYDIIGDKAALLKSDGVDQEVINDFITTDINIHLKSFYRNHGFTFDTNDKLAEIVDEWIIDMTREIYELVKERLNYEFQSNFIYAMSLHISSFLKRIQIGSKRDTQLNENIRNMVLDYREEFQVAKEIKQLIEERYQMMIPEFETYYLTVLLVSLKKNNDIGRIGIVVAAHGKSTATSMVQVVSQLMNVDNLQAVDMPLEMKPKAALEEIIKAVRTVNQGNGVLLLVDMGSLSTFTDEIIERTGIMVKTVDMVTTPIVLEAARKTSMLETKLTDVYDTLKDFHGYARLGQVGQQDTTHMFPPIKQRAIIAICASGEGTAQRMKELIERYLAPYENNDLVVLPSSILNIRQDISSIRQKYQVVAATGIADPDLDVPFIPMENFFSENSAQIVAQLVEPATPVIQDVNVDEEQARNACIDYMRQSFVFINPDKVIDPLWQFAERVSGSLSRPVEYTFYLNLIMHLAGMLERLIHREPLTVEKDQIDSLQRDAAYDAVVRAVAALESTFKVSVPQSELYFLVQIAQNAQKIKMDNTDDL